MCVLHVVSSFHRLPVVVRLVLTLCSPERLGGGGGGGSGGKIIHCRHPNAPTPPPVLFLFFVLFCFGIVVFVCFCIGAGWVSK